MMEIVSPNVDDMRNNDTLREFDIRMHRAIADIVCLQEPQCNN